MSKRRVLIPAIIIILISVIALQYPKLYIATGYGAKCLASGVFVADRDPVNVVNQDLDYSIVKHTKSVIDYKNKTVTTSFLGMAEQTACFREGLGCALIDPDKDRTAIKKSFEKPVVNRDALWRKPWPVGDKLNDTVFQEINIKELDTAIDNAFDNKGDNRKRTAAVVVVYKGEIVGEKYWEENGINADTPLWGWSMTKSIINAITGILVKKDMLSTNDPAPVDLWQDDKRKDITISNLLQMSSGLQWEENYATVSDATKMLYRSNDTYASSVSVQPEKSPDAEWYYSSGTTNILSGIIRHTIGNDNEYLTFPYNELFNKTGMHSMTMETDAVGNFVGSSYAYATARDWARFGLLYFNDGIWQGNRILPAGWVKYTTSPAKASEGKYGAHFWLNKAGDLPDVPEDMYSCNGHRGQRIFIIPSRHLVIVRLGFSESDFDHNDFLKEVLAAINN
jgi:CubicO group peptidase (beta-lactamase class C family)